MSQKARRHTHKYYQATLSYGKVWACALEDCTHYMPQHITELVIGKQSICWTCEEKFRLNPTNMKMQRPICDDCTLGIVQPTWNAILPEVESAPQKSINEMTKDEIVEYMKR